MSYERHYWQNDKAPALNAENLNQVEKGIADAHDLIAAEATARAAAVTAEATARAAAVTAEESAREAAVAAEKTAREAADTLLTTGINGIKNDLASFGLTVVNGCLCAVIKEGE